MKTRMSLLVCCLFVLCSLNVGEQNGYSNLNELFQEFPVVLKSNDWKAIERYVTKILPDKETVSYMQKNNFQYRGLPESAEKYPMVLEYSRTAYLYSLARFRFDLERNGQLKDLEFVKVEDERIEMFDANLGIEATETFIVLKSGDKEILCKLGEMFKVNGVWKSFTEPKLGW